MLGVHEQTLRAWDRQGLLTPVRLPSGQRRYREEDLVAMSQGVPPARGVALYARVSTKKQEEMGNLDRQKERLLARAASEGMQVVAVCSDVASGLNTKRRGLAQVVKAARNDKIDVVLVEHRDRLARFGFEYLVWLFDAFGVRVEVMDSDEATGSSDSSSELVNDLLAIVASFAARLYGSRGGKRVRAKVSSTLAEEAARGSDGKG